MGNATFKSSEPKMQAFVKAYNLSQAGSKSNEK